MKSLRGCKLYGITSLEIYILNSLFGDTRMSYVERKQNIQILYHSIFNFCFKNILVTSTVDFSYAEQSVHILNPLRHFPRGWKVECLDFALEAFFPSKNRPVSPRTPGCDINGTALKHLTAPPATCAQFPQRCLSVIDNTLVNYV